MTPAALLRDMRAAHAARNQYRKAADRLANDAIDMLKGGWHGWAVECARFANIAERAAKAEER